MTEAGRTPQPPTVSVIMPVYNAIPYLFEAVGSILGQTFSDFEFIIIDDGSTDGSTEALLALAASDSRIVLVSRPNTGYAVALNEALGLARGSFVARMDADDVSLPGRLTLQVAHLRSDAGCVGVGGAMLMIDEAGRPVARFAPPADHAEIDAAHLAAMTSVIVHPAVMMRADVLASVGGYRSELEPAEDLDLWLRLAERGRLANLGEPLLKYRLHAGSVSTQRRRSQREQAYAAVMAACERRGLPAPKPPADESPGGRADMPHHHWVRMAAVAGNHAVARRFAWKALRAAPLAPQTWRTAAIALLGPAVPAMLRIRGKLRSRAAPP